MPLRRLLRGFWKKVLSVAGLDCVQHLLMGCLQQGQPISRPGLWLASGHFRTSALQGPLTGHILAELIQGRAAPFGLDLSAFDPDRFGGWAG
jgi:glycine/D-amino acid oxidase-like deaminating enzyme